MCCFCRYNISTQDYEAWDDGASSANNTQLNNTNLDVFSRFGFNVSSALEVCNGNQFTYLVLMFFLYFSSVATTLEIILKYKCLRGLTLNCVLQLILHSLVGHSRTGIYLLASLCGKFYN